MKQEKKSIWGFWDADHEVLDGHKSAYLVMEGWIEGRMGDVVTAEDIAGWGALMGAVLGDA